MIRSVLLTAVLTGAFCAFFAVGIDFLTEMLERGQVIGISFTSGFLAASSHRPYLSAGGPRM